MTGLAPKLGFPRRPGGPTGDIGTVTSVGLTVPTGLSVTPATITTSGTFAITYAAGYQGYTTAEANKLSNITLTAAINLDTLSTTVAGKLDKSGGTMTGALTLAADPASALQAATKQYVDGLAANVGKRGRARAATTANITISTGLVAGQVIDGVTLANGDWVLVKNQTTAAQNGIYVVSASPARAAEFDTYNEHPGSLIAAEEGTTNADTLWLCTSNDGGTIGTTAINFSKMVTAGELLAANNLSDLASAATAFSNIKQAATTSTTGVVELATAAEMTAGVATGVIPDVKQVADYVAANSGGSFRVRAAAWIAAAGTITRNVGDTISVSKTGTGAYTITHSTISNPVVLATINASSRLVAVLSTSGTSTTIDTRTTSGTAVDLDFSIAIFG